MYHTAFCIKQKDNVDNLNISEASIIVVISEASIIVVISEASIIVVIQLDRSLLDNYQVKDSILNCFSQK